MQAIGIVGKVLSKGNAINGIDKAKANLSRLRLLLYMCLVESFSSEEFVEHLRAKPFVLRRMGLKEVPDIKEIEEWRNQLNEELENILNEVWKRYLQLSKDEWIYVE